MGSFSTKPKESTQLQPNVDSGFFLKRSQNHDKVLFAPNFVGRPMLDILDLKYEIYKTFPILEGNCNKNKTVT